MIRIPLIGSLTYCVASGELMSKATSPASNAVLGEAKLSYI